jgi:hypothetical protein
MGLHIPFWNRKDEHAEHGMALISALVGGHRRCVLTTRSRTGEPHARKLRLSNYAVGHSASLIFVVPKTSEVAEDVARDSHVVLSMLDPRSGRLVHLEGSAALFDDRHSPAYLHPSVRGPKLHVVAGEVDFALLRVEVPLVEGELLETQPPADVRLPLPETRPAMGGATSFLRSLLS